MKKRNTPLANDEAASGTEVIKSVIRHLTKGCSSAQFEGTVSATVRGELKMDSSVIKVLLIFDGTNYAKINIFWEDYGYADFRDVGLYGEMNTGWTRVKRTGLKSFQIYCPDYKIDVAY